MSRFRYYSNEGGGDLFLVRPSFVLLRGQKEREERRGASLDASDQMVSVEIKRKKKISESERRLNNKLSVLTQIPFGILTRVAAHAHLVTPYLAEMHLTCARLRRTHREAPPQNTDTFREY